MFKLQAGQLLMFRLIVSALEHDLSHRAAVFAVHRQHELLTGSVLWRLLDNLSFNVKTKQVMSQVAHELKLLYAI